MTGIIETKCLLTVGLAVAVVSGGCVAQPDADLVRLVYAGEHGRARLYMSRVVATQSKPRIGSDRNLDRAYLLNRMRLALITLADGYIRAGDLVFEELYDVLRTQGINRDKTVEAVVFNEDLKTWKGEPFEQAMAFFYTAVHYAQQGDWANARAAADNSLFYLRDFDHNQQGQRRNSEQIIYEAMENEDYLDHGYAAVQSDFALGYLMHGVASQQLGRDHEASDHFNQAVHLNAYLRPLVDRFQTVRYNLILVIDYGRGPRKIGTGPDNAIAKFIATIPSDNSPILVSTRDGAGGLALPVVCDLNVMATDHMWNNLHDVRIAKSAVGSVLLATGSSLIAHGADRDRKSTFLAGLGMMAAGVFAKAGAHADTRYCELMPQRVYVVPLWIENVDTKIIIEVKSIPASRIVLVGVRPEPHGAMPILRYVRLVSPGPADPTWTVSGKIHYANDATPHAVTSKLPYILGGNCVRAPSETVLASYQATGFLSDMTLSQLEDLYRAENIEIHPDTPLAQPRRHILEGGTSLVGPVAGTAGFARMFGRMHGTYEPKSSQVRELAECLRRQLSPQRFAHCSMGDTVN